MSDLIDRNDLLKNLEEIKAQKGKLYQNDYRDAINNAEAVSVESSSTGWIPVESGLPEGPYETFVKVKRPFSSELVVVIAKYSPEGFYNGGRNKWSCEPVVGPMAGCKVVAWVTAPEI